MKNENNRSEKPSSQPLGLDESLHCDPLRNHAPIIITGEGSVGVEFHRGCYPQTDRDTYQSTNLIIESVTITDLDDSTELCHTVQRGEDCLIEVVCRKAGKFDRNIKVLGGMSLSPSINFKHDEYLEVSVPGKPHRRKHFNHERKILEVKIYRVINGEAEDDPFHTCDVPSNGKCAITISDVHPRLRP